MTEDVPTLHFSQLESATSREWLRTGYDLLITAPDGSERRQPLCYAHMNVGSSRGPRPNDVVIEGDGVSNRQAILHYRQGDVFFTNSNPDCPALVNGNVSNFRQLQDQDEVMLGGWRIRLVGLMEQLAFLEGYTEGYRDRQWALGLEPATIGRKGKRLNRVELEDRTVSREHATIELMEGNFVIRPDTHSSPTLVNGERITNARVLTDGDLVQVGRQILRFRTGKGSTRPKALLPREATILFADVWDYCSLAESRPLEETIGQLNEFYQGMGEVILAHRGMLMTYLGDAMMAVFGAEGVSEDDPVRAVAAAVQMQERLVELNRVWEAQGKPVMRLGIGINTGEVMVGDVGFEGSHEFAALGDNANLAARVEKLTREYACSIMISGSTEGRVRHSFSTRSLGTTRIKGRQAPVDLYEVLGPLTS